MLVAFYSLAAVALIVDSGRGLPEGFPFLDRIRALRAHFGDRDAGPGMAALPPVHHETPPGVAAALPGRLPDSERVRVNRGLP
jgi:hypothetical protein